MVRWITTIIVIIIILGFLDCMITEPMQHWQTAAYAAYTGTTEPAHGLTQTNPAFQGMESGYSSESIHVTNEYGDYGWEVNECWLTTFIAGLGGIWEPGVPRVGTQGAELIDVHKGREVDIYDWNRSDYFSLGIEVTTAECYIYAPDLNINMFGDATYEVRVNEQGHTPSSATNDFVYIQHDGTDGEVGTDSTTGAGAGGNLGLRPDSGSNVYIMDNAGGGDDYYFPNGDGANGQVLFTNGANRLSWGDIMTRATEATVTVNGGDSTKIVLASPLVGTAEDAIVWVVCRQDNGGWCWHAGESPVPVADQVVFKWRENGSGNLEVLIWNDCAFDVEATCWYANY